MPRKEKVREMFNDIAPTYDQLNNVLSLGIDKLWRKRAMKHLTERENKLILDVACGTGELSFEALRYGAERVIGVDISDEMLAVAKKKAAEKEMKERLDFRYGDGESLDFQNETFDAVTVAFGIRNFESPSKGLREMYRVLKPGGVVLILEFSMPRRTPVKQLYKLYFTSILPKIGGVLSGDRKAYRYLPQSVLAFPQREQFMDLLKDCGFKNVKAKPLTFGVATLYIGER